MFETMGHAIGGKIYLQPEEAMFLAERGSLEITWKDVSLSIQQCFDMLFPENHQLHKYQVYLHLKRLGFIVLAHITEHGRKRKLVDEGLESKEVKKHKSSGFSETHTTKTASSGSTPNAVSETTDPTGVDLSVSTSYQPWHMKSSIWESTYYKVAKVQPTDARDIRTLKKLASLAFQKAEQCLDALKSCRPRPLSSACLAHMPVWESEEPASFGKVLHNLRAVERIGSWDEEASNYVEDLQIDFDVHQPGAAFKKRNQAVHNSASLCAGMPTPCRGLRGCDNWLQWLGMRC
eukprot:Colp12_sorted_trinity150504_noHs@17316